MIVCTQKAEKILLTASHLSYTRLNITTLRWTVLKKATYNHHFLFKSYFRLFIIAEERHTTLNLVTKRKRTILWAARDRLESLYRLKWQSSCRKTTTTTRTTTGRRGTLRARSFDGQRVADGPCGTRRDRKAALGQQLFPTTRIIRTTSDT